MIDRQLAKEIAAMCGNGSREAEFALLAKLRAASASLSDHPSMQTINNSIRKHGRAAVAVCIAATLYKRRERLGRWQIEWADGALAAWRTKTPSHIEDVQIRDDRLHPTAICNYARSFIELTTEVQE